MERLRRATTMLRRQLRSWIRRRDPVPYWSVCTLTLSEIDYPEVVRNIIFKCSGLWVLWSQRLRESSKECSRKQKGVKDAAVTARDSRECGRLWEARDCNWGHLQSTKSPSDELNDWERRRKTRRMILVTRRCEPRRTRHNRRDSNMLPSWRAVKWQLQIPQSSTISSYQSNVVLFGPKEWQNTLPWASTLRRGFGASLPGWQQKMGSMTACTLLILSLWLPSLTWISYKVFESLFGTSTVICRNIEWLISRRSCRGNPNLRRFSVKIFTHGINVFMELICL